MEELLYNTVKKQKLLKFNNFVEAILPHEAYFLKHSRRFDDEEKNQILDTIILKVLKNEPEIVFDENIDKRKYSYVKDWCSKLIDHFDVDKMLGKLFQWEHQIMTDTIVPETEKELLKLSKSVNASYFNFVKLYEVYRVYRHFLQIRLRHRDFEIINNFINKYRTDYEYSRLVNDKLHEATTDIINQFVLKKEPGQDWFPWLSTIFYNETLDGYNRMLAWVRLVFIAHNQHDYKMLEGMFAHFDQMLNSGRFYSRRILTNFYSQCLLYNASINNFAAASKYGYLSIKEQNNDYLYYVNNLAAVLLRNKKPKEALSLLQSTNNLSKSSPNIYNKIGHVAFMVFALIDCDKTKQAENHAFVFQAAFKKDIFEYRWHLFFTAYSKAMLLNKNYNQLIKTFNQLKLLDKDEEYRKRANYTPSLPWMYYLAKYKSGNCTIIELKKELVALNLFNKEPKGLNFNHDLNELSNLVLQNEWKRMELNLE